MKWFCVITVLATFSNLNDARPSQDVEIEKLRLVKFPDENFHYQAHEQSDETRRILEEIQKINVALGYVKRHEKPQHLPTILDSNTYLFPQSSYHPLHVHDHHDHHLLSGSSSGTSSLPPSIRNFEKPYSYQPQSFISRKITHHHSVMIPQTLDAPMYLYPEPYLRSPVLNHDSKSFKNTAEKVEEKTSESNIPPQKLMAISNDVTNIVEYSPNPKGFHEIADRYHDHDHSESQENDDHQSRERIVSNMRKENAELSRRLLGDLKKIIADDPQNKRAKSKIENIHTEEDLKKILPEFILLPSKHLSNTGERYGVNQNFTKSINKTDKKPTEVKLKTVTSRPPYPTSIAYPLERAPLGLLRPRPTKPTSTPTTSTTMQTANIPARLSETDDGHDHEQGTEKYFLSALNSLNSEALRQGGIIIQRLKVRKGGIAIAGPGGVATAGSGGTAIVGPGGLALTHPKSLTIAGPGARVVALPENFDLEKAILKSTPKILPKEGKVVATGPTIYYHPEEGRENPSELLESTSEHTINLQDFFKE